MAMRVLPKSSRLVRAPTLRSFSSAPALQTNGVVRGAPAPFVGSSDAMPDLTGAPADLRQVALDLKESEPEEVVEWAQSVGNVAMISSFGMQAAVLLHMANAIIPGIPVLMIDTGYLPKETYLYAEELKERLNLNLIVVSNAEWSPARMEAIHGKLWEQDDAQAHKLYGQITKVAPLMAGLAALEVSPDVLLSGVRASQTAARANMPRVSRQGDGRVKALPLLNMSDDDIDFYFWDHELPRHPLAAEGYVTVGDWHSSRPLEEGEDARDTRFGGKFQECGLHLEEEAPQKAPGPHDLNCIETDQEAPAK